MSTRVYSQGGRGMQRDNTSMRVALLTGVAGLVVGFSVGYVHGMHEHHQCVVTAPCPAPSSSANDVTNALAAAERRIDALEKKKAGGGGVASEVIQYNAELLEEIEALRAQGAKKSSSRGEGSVELGFTSWKHVVSYNREELWKKALAGYPYAGGASSSRDALLFMKNGKELSSCDELNVVVASNKPGVCLAVFDSRLPVYTMLRVDNTAEGGILEAQRKKANPKRYVSPSKDTYSPERLEHRAVILPQADTLPMASALKESLAATGAFALEAPRLTKEVQAIIRKHKMATRNNTVVVMATNFGTVDLIANFACSCRSAGIGLENVLVFAADKYSKMAVERLGLTSFYDPGLGKLPDQAAVTYGDHAFVRMMWLKVTAVYLVVAAGHSVLFQDADVVWLKDPLLFFAESDPAVDTYWMDDGARSVRYTPFYSNSGFYFLRHNHRTLYFMYRLLVSYDNILAVRSHQHALIMVLLDTVAKYGLTVNVLDNAMFPQGQVFHHKKALMQKIVDGDANAFVFHMCWTAGRKDKLKYMKNMGLWFLQPTCDLDAFTQQRQYNNRTLTDTLCCHNLPAFHAPNPYSSEITIKST